jgi:mannosyltransferase
VNKPPARRSFDAQLVILLIILGVALFLRVYQLDQKGLWADEIFTSVFSTQENNLATITERALSTPIPTPPLWFVLTHLYQKVFGPGTITLRMPAVIFGVLGVAATYYLGRLLIGRLEGLIVASLIAVSPLHIYFSREARFYPAIVFFSVLTIIFLYNALRTKRTLWWVLFTVATLLNLYTHLTAFFVLAAELAFFSILNLATIGKRIRSGLAYQTILQSLWLEALPLLLSVFFILILYAPMIPSLIRGINGERGFGSLVPTEGFALSIDFIFALFSNLSGGRGLAVSLFMAFALIGSLVIWRREGNLLALFFSFIVIPLLIIVVLKPKHWFAYKYLIFLLPVYLFMVAAGLVEIASNFSNLRKWKRANSQRHLYQASLAICLTALLAINGAVIPEARSIQNDRWEAASEIIFQNVQDGDAIAVLPVDILTFQADELIGHSFDLPAGVTLQRVDSPEDLDGLLAKSNRLWVVVAPFWERASEELFLTWLGTKPALNLEVQGIQISLMQRDTSLKELLQTAKDFELSNAQALGSIASGFASIGEFQEALVAYQRSIQLDPNEGTWHLGTASIYQSLGDYSSAETAYLNAIAVEPAQPGFLAAYADFLRRSGDPSRAVHYYKLAIEAWNSAYPGNGDSPFLNAWKDQIDLLSSTF